MLLVVLFVMVYAALILRPDLLRPLRALRLITVVLRVSQMGATAAATAADISALRAEIEALRRQLDPGTSLAGDDSDRRSHAAQPSG
ncbi:hypothetical protein [Micromonospora tarensis]|uniref:Uncharacterized protein n=1 Tax=Micromonospora tarensis TaxID=2806100 RepID=A0ABS1YCS8_9ACTN|nr:hypothetical protein [Micromonospora tarensis]MBM0275200.1 hypothetical protein [Micromonospora tarensis]